jgi:hypothetical protein
MYLLLEEEEEDTVKNKNWNCLRNGVKIMSVQRGKK